MFNLCEFLCSTTWQPEKSPVATPDEVVGDAPAQVPQEGRARAMVYSPGYADDGRLLLVSYNGNPPQLALSDNAVADLAKSTGIPLCHLKAVLAVESVGSGFLLHEPYPARPKILFEAHWFYKLSGNFPISRIRPDLSSKHWNRRLYKGGSAEWGRLEDALGLAEDLAESPDDERMLKHAALKSCSWGLGQVMGFNYKIAGCDSIEQFVRENHQGEKQQFLHMLSFIEENGLTSALRKGDWHAFARGYNGAGYRKNKYHLKLARAASRCA